MPEQPRAADWSRYVLDAPVMMMRVDDTRSVALRGPHSFEQWILDGHALGWPTLDDLAYHVTTLFPPVRPRGWLELRMIDALPEAWWPVAVAVTVALLDDPLAAEWATSATAGVARSLGRPRRAMRCTILRSPDAARWCFDAAQLALERVGADAATIDATEEYADALRRAEHAALPTTCSTIGPDAPSLPADVVTKAEIVASLEESRRRTLGLLAPVPDAEQRGQVSELMSPLCWDLAHIGHYEELWLLRELVGAAPTDAAFDDVYDAFKHPRRDRPALDILDAGGARAFDAAVRDPGARGARRPSTSTATSRCSPTGSSTAWSCNTSTSTTRRCSRRSSSWTTSRTLPPTATPATRALTSRPRASTCPRDVLVAAGEHVLGTDTDAVGVRQRTARARGRARRLPDRHHRGHQRRVHPSSSTPAATTTPRPGPRRGGRGAPKPSSRRRSSGRATPPAGGSRRRFGRTEPVPARRAGAARLLVRGRRVRAVGRGTPPHRGGVGGGRARHAPRHGADLWRDGPRRFAPAPVGTTADVVSTHGARTGCSAGCGSGPRPTSCAYPGFRSFPYREYSEVFFGPEYKVLRGGSWATHPSAVRTTFRNWDFPIRRQIFAGFRCARDA